MRTKLLKRFFLTMMLMVPASAYSAGQCKNTLFILDDSGSISSGERTDMTTSVQALADAIELAAPGVKIGVIQYSSQNAGGKHYVIESGLVVNPTIMNTAQGGLEDFLPTSIAQMEGDGLFTGTGAFANTDAIFIFTDAQFGQGSGSWITGTGIPTAGVAATTFPASTAFTEYSGLSTSLGSIPISMFRVETGGGSVAGVEQAGGILDEGNVDFKMTTAQINAFSQSLSCGVPNPANIPTLSNWMLILLSLMLMGVGLHRRIRPS